MNLLKTPEQDFAEIEQRLRSTYAHVANELVSECNETSANPVGADLRHKSSRRRFGVWTPRVATLGAVAGIAFAGFNLANPARTSLIAADESSVFKSFPHLVPTAPADHKIQSITRQLTPLVPGSQTVYPAKPGRMPLTLSVGGSSFRAMGVPFETKVISGRTVLIAQDPALLVIEVSDKRCGTINIFGITKENLRDTVQHLRCRKVGQDFRAELSNRKRSEISFSGPHPQPYARLHFHIGHVRKGEYFAVTSEPCRCENFGVTSVLGSEPRIIAGKQVFLTPDRAPDGTLLERKSVVWAPSSSALFTLNFPFDWNSTQIEAVIRSVEEVDQATFTSLLESNGIKEVSLVA